MSQPSPLDRLLSGDPISTRLIVASWDSLAVESQIEVLRKMSVFDPQLVERALDSSAALCVNLIPDILSLR